MTWLMSLDTGARRLAVAEVVILAQTWLASKVLPITSADAARDESDRTLIDRARRGEPGAIVAIYERHAAAVYRRLTRLVGPDPEREDLMQEVFVDLFHQLDRYRGDASLRTYVLRIVSNKACDHLRQRRRRTVVETSRWPGLVGQDAGDLRSSAPSPEDRVGQAQELALVEQALDRLTAKKRVAFVLRVVDNLSLKEIAEQVGATVFTVAQRIRHADRELRRRLEHARHKLP